MCHHPGGNAIVSFYLRRDLPFQDLNTNKGTGIGTFGMRNARIIVPGDPYRSVLFYRMSKLGYARMPYIGSQVVDGKGIDLIDQWIRSLATAPDGESSGPLTQNSNDAHALAVLEQHIGGNEKITNAVQQLVASTEGTLAMSSRMHAGAIKGNDFSRALAIGREVPRSDVAGLLETFIPERERRKRPWAQRQACVDPGIGRRRETWKADLLQRRRAVPCLPPYRQR